MVGEGSAFIPQSSEGGRRWSWVAGVVVPGKPGSGPSRIGNVGLWLGGARPINPGPPPPLAAAGRCSLTLHRPARPHPRFKPLARRLNREPRCGHSSSFDGRTRPALLPLAVERPLESRLEKEG
jgi:hypothetical protein